MQVAKWGNSLAVRLPTALVEELGLKEGDDITLKPAGKRSYSVEKAPSTDEIFEQIRKIRRPLPPDYKFNREDANSRLADEGE